MAIVGSAIVLGGGGTVNPFTETILQTLTAILMIPLVASSRWQSGLGHVPRAAWLLGFLVLLMPIVHLIPLPPSIWQNLPGRDVEVQSLAAAGSEHAWMPLSMAPARTFASLLAMICGVLTLLQISRLSEQGRNWVASVICVGGLSSLVVGVLQLSRTGGFTWSFYSEFSEGFLNGFQANRNAEADLLINALLASGILVTARLSDGRHHLMTWSALVLAVLVFAFGVFMTGSRTGIALILPGLAWLAIMLWPMLRRRGGALRWTAFAAPALGISALLLTQLTSIQKVLARFSLTTEARWDLWADTWYAMGRVWPYGSGIGTIVPMLEAAERLDVVDTSRPVRAHNDWLEWLLECGAPGVVVLGLIVLLVMGLAARALIAAHRSGASANRRAQVIFACGVLTIEALHAILDYPMRSMSLAMLTAVAAAFLIEPAAVQREES